MAAHAAACIDAFSEGQLLTGEATSPSLEELKRRALVIHQQKKRLFVFFGTPDSECHAVGPATRCFCGHSYSSHAWYETDTKRVRCRVEGCRCECFKIVPGRGSTHIRCACKHSHADHCSQGRPGGCRLCACDHFHSDWRCACGATYDEHSMSFMTAAERVAAGLPVEENLGGWAKEKPHLEAVCGGVTRMTSLLSGVERLGIAPLPHTDGTAAAGPAACPAACAASSTAAMLSSYDQRADAHVARLRKLRDGQAARAGGRRLGSGPTPLAPPGPTPPATARGRGGAGGGARGSGLVGAPPSARAQRELAAAAAEARAAAAAELQCVPCTAAAATTALVATAGRPAARPHASNGGARPPAPKGLPAAGRPRRSSAGAAVAAARRERAANAAEKRMGIRADGGSERAE